jgi:hypothetical protein
LGFRVWGWGFGGLGFTVQGSGFGGGGGSLGLGVWGFGFRSSGFRVWGWGFGVWVSEFRVQGLGVGVSTLEFVPACLLPLSSTPAVLNLNKSAAPPQKVDSYLQPRYRGALDCARKVLAAEGAAGMFRGFGPALMRSFPANAVCFATYEAVVAVASGSG